METRVVLSMICTTCDTNPGSVSEITCIQRCSRRRVCPKDGGWRPKKRGRDNLLLSRRSALTFGGIQAIVVYFFALSTAPPLAKSSSEMFCPCRILLYRRHSGLTRNVGCALACICSLRLPSTPTFLCEQISLPLDSNSRAHP